MKRKQIKYNLREWKGIESKTANQSQASLCVHNSKKYVNIDP